ncbi:MAG: hypothetical protein LBJ08_03365, partial [Bifidobacteriaceae bacterium]|nr:hypothetical protein [Bifidobacteriaceae bacterium]
MIAPRLLTVACALSLVPLGVPTMSAQPSRGWLAPGVVAAKATPKLTGVTSGDKSYHGYTSVTFGLNLEVNGRPAAGHVYFREGKTQIASIRLKGGTAIYSLPKDL